jgi:glycine betaine/choline ABC-type transport system substrate-binding protein
MKNVKRRPNGRVLAVLMLALVVFVAACGDDDDDSGSSSTTTATATRIDSQLVFGGPTECQERPLCLGKGVPPAQGSQEIYGLQFKEVRKLDTGGPITASALKDGSIQVGLLFTGSSVIDPDFVLLEDDKGLQAADNPIALMSEEAATEDVTRIVDAVNEKLTLEAYNKMSTGITEDKLDAEDVAKQFLADAGLDTEGTTGEGTELTVGAVDFAGAEAISQAYGQALAANGYDVNFASPVKTREVAYPLLENGEIDLYGEFTGSLLTYLKGTPTADSNATYTALQDKLEGTGLVASAPSTAQDVNGFYVTKETADKYGLTTVSDLTKTQ